MNKKLKIIEQLEKIEQRLANAEAYVASGVNIEGAALLHFDDWEGKSGHPSWMRNFMIPAVKKGRAKKEKALETITRKEREVRRQRRKKQKAHEQRD